MKDFLKTNKKYLSPNLNERFRVSILKHIPGEDWPYKSTSLEAVCIVDAFRYLNLPETVEISGQVYGFSRDRILQGIVVYDATTRNCAMDKLNNLAKEMNAQFEFHYYLTNY